jgi:alanine dehydrogenase
MSFIIGVRKETKPQERRVVLRPNDLFDLAQNAAKNTMFLVEEGAGVGSGFDDSLYTTMGGKVVPFRKDGQSELFTRSNMVVGVKEPLPAEWPYLPENQIHFAFFHYPSGKELYEFMKSRRLTAIAFESVEEADGSRPLLAGMSVVAAEYSIRMANKYFFEAKGRPWSHSMVIVFGAKGVYGRNAMKRAMDRGALTIGFDMNANEEETEGITGCMGGCKRICPGLLGQLNGRILRPTPTLMAKLLPYADVYMMGAAARNKPAPKILTQEWFEFVKPGAFIADASVDEGGCTVLRVDAQNRSKPTSHVDPVATETVGGKQVLYCGVPNMPGGIPEMATELISREVARYIPRILAHVNPDNTFNRSLMTDEALVKGFALYRGIPVDKYIAGLFGDTCVPLETLLK